MDDNKLFLRFKLAPPPTLSLLVAVIEVVRVGVLLVLVVAVVVVAVVEMLMGECMGVFCGVARDRLV